MSEGYGSGQGRTERKQSGLLLSAPRCIAPDTTSYLLLFRSYGSMRDLAQASGGFPKILAPAHRN
jgi:hypothetical protein